MMMSVSGSSREAFSVQSFKHMGGMKLVKKTLMFFEAIGYTLVLIITSQITSPAAPCKRSLVFAQVPHLSVHREFRDSMETDASASSNCQGIGGNPRAKNAELLGK
ncbi:hypothetical protein C5167_003753 [Papaver somniferum]|uniref:Uncharacterized protein n=1 Tax=Papaver somniferum TaxID=3469 RepID=A0A4Y7L4H4_PAPSO|nr:hypothetical protein C5167_003753 [Papaver somniferum]